MFDQMLVYKDPLKLTYKINPYTPKMYSLSSIIPKRVWKSWIPFIISMVTF